MRAGEHNVARAYVLYREERAKERAKVREKQAAERDAARPALNVMVNGVAEPPMKLTLIG
ncbi:ribonucleotide-diphosphate reductase subunit alpha [compost metagenome]